MPKETNITNGQTQTTTLETLLQLLVNHTINAPTNNAFNVLPDLTQSIRNFTGEFGEDQLASEWLKDINNTATLHHWPENAKLQMACSHLTGPARDWYIAHLDEFTNWATFESAFKRTFVGELSYTQRFAKMQDRIQNRGESVNAYFHSKMRLCQSLKLDFSDIKENIIMGLASRNITRSLITSRHDNSDELLSDIIKLDRVDQNTPERVSWRTRSSEPLINNRNLPLSSVRPSNEASRASVDSSRSTHFVPRHGNFTSRPVAGSRPPEGRRPTSNRNNLQCFNCRAFGHGIRDCPEPRRTSVSSTSRPVNSTNTATPNNGQIGAGSTVNTVDTSTNIPNTNIIHDKTVRINDKFEIKCLIDSGSSSCLIRESVAKNNNLTWEKNNTVICGFGASAVTTVVGKTTLQFMIDEARLDNVDTFVVPDNSMSRDAIIGRPWCESPSIAFVKYGNILTFYNKGSFPFASMDTQVLNDATDAKKVINCERKIVPAHHSTFITTTVGEVVVEVPVHNPSDNDLILEANQTIARRANYCFAQPKTEQPYMRPLTFDDIQCPVTLNLDEQRELLDILNEYRQCFALSLSELGCTDVSEMNIMLKDGTKPFAAKPYRTSQEEREEIRRQVNQWREYGIVEDTNSPHAAPVLLVRKKTGESRLVIDYRRLNENTVRQPYPLPCIDDLLQYFVGTSMYSVLDLAHAYMQIPLSKESRPQTAFITPDGTGQFTRMTFGLVNAPFEFSRAMDRAMGPLRHKIVLNYFDDYFIPAVDWVDMKRRLRSVLTALSDAKLTLRPSKCIFAAREIEFLGFRLSADGLKPGENKIGAIKNYVMPKNVHEVRRFMGLISFFRRFVPKFAERARPITDLTRANVPFVWTDRQQGAFDELKLVISSKPVLRLFDPAKPTELHTDASALGLAAMLLQKDSDGRLYLVYCISKKTNDAEKLYHSSKLELMAIVWALDRFRPWLLGIHTTVVTDCQALVYMNTMRTSKPQIARWFDLIQEFDLEVKHKPGSSMCHVDALSRAPVEPPTDTMDDIISNRLDVFTSMTEEEYIRCVQRSDSELINIITALENGTENVQITRDYEMRYGALYRKICIMDENRSLWMVPNTLRKSLVIRYHDLAGHFSVDRTVKRILEKYWFPRLKNYVKRHIRFCPECALFKVPRGKVPGELHPIQPGERPFSVLNMDHLGPFPASSKKNQYLLVIVCNLTKFVKLYASRTISSKKLITQLTDFMLTFGHPRQIISDRGSVYRSADFENFVRTEVFAIT